MTTSEPTAVEPTPPAPEPPRGCCGGPAPEETGACCVRDAEVKAKGGSGCGCRSEPEVSRKSCC